MTKVIVNIVGAAPVVKEANTLGELKKAMNLEAMSALVNGVPQSNEYALSKGDEVDFVSNVKGA